MDYGHFRVYSKALSIWFWKFALDPVVVIFFKNAKQITSGGLILSLGKFFAKNIYVVKNTSSDIINSELVIFTT